MRRIVLAFLCIAAVSIHPLMGQRQPFNVDTMLKLARIGEPALSPDGTQVAFTVQKVDLASNTKPVQVYVVPAQGGAPTPWHQDKAFYTRKTTHRTVTFWIPLQPVAAEGGCLRFIPRSHLGPLLQHRHLGGDGRIHGLEAMGLDDSQAVSCPLEAGGVTVHHHLTLHGAGTNVSRGERWAYAMGFGIRSATPIVGREYTWNRVTRTAREARFQNSLGGRNRVSYRLRALLVQWGLI